MIIKTPYYFILSNYCYKIGYSNTAARYYKKLVESAPGVRRWRQTYVNMLIKVKKYDEASQQIDKLLKLDSGNIDYLLLQARCYTNMDRYNMAQKIYHYLLLKEPYDCRVSYYVANSYFKNDQYDDATKYYERAINLASEFGNDEISSFAHHRLGCIYETMGDPKKTTNHYVQAVDNSKYKQVASCGVGYLHFRAGWYELALTEYKKLAKINSNNPELWFEMGRVHSNLNQQVEAAKCYKKFIEHDPVYQENPGIEEKQITLDVCDDKIFPELLNSIRNIIQKDTKYKDYRFVFVLQDFDLRHFLRSLTNRNIKAVLDRSREYFRTYAKSKYWITSHKIDKVLKDYDNHVYIQYSDIDSLNDSLHSIET